MSDATLAFERSILGAFYIDAEGTAAAVLDAGLIADDFKGDEHPLLISACLDLARRGAPVDAITLQNVLERDGRYSMEIGTYLVELSDAATTAANVSYYCRRLSAERRGDTTADADAQSAQLVDTERYLGLESDQFLRWPWPSLDQQLGGIAPGDTVFIVSNSGGGKTSFMLSLVDRYLPSGIRIYYAGLESRPKWLRSQLACRVLGIDPGPVFAGDAQRQHDWPLIRDRLIEEVRGQGTNPFYKNLRFSPHEFIGARQIEEIGNAAAAFKADLLIIDHVDHIDPEGDEMSTFKESRRINLGIKRLADRTQLRVMATSQTNWTGLAADPWRNHRPVREESVYMGGHKKQMAAAMIGLFRPMLEDIQSADLTAVREGKLNKSKLLQPGVMAVNVMKSRNYGAHEGNVVRLGFHRGEVRNTPVSVIGGE